ncbi:hypothetical protein KC353_g22483, partial [Hortaea werneckii]
QYDDDDLYDEEDDYGEEPQEEYTAEDKDNFATLTPVVRAELEEAGLSVSDSDIQESLWHYYWDVGKSVSYLKNARTPRQQQDKNGSAKKEKSKSKFDQAAEKNAEKTVLSCPQCQPRTGFVTYRGAMCLLRSKVILNLPYLQGRHPNYSEAQRSSQN